MKVDINRNTLLQVVKNRYGGMLGIMPLFFHKDSLTMSKYFMKKSKTQLQIEDKPQKPQDSQLENKEEFSFEKESGLVFKQQSKKRKRPLNNIKKKPK